MKWAMATALLAGQILIGSPLVSAQELIPPLTPAEQRAFEACMFAAWVEDYCESTYWVLPPVRPGSRMRVGKWWRKISARSSSSIQ
jgi:hypothetical protein